MAAIRTVTKRNGTQYRVLMDPADAEYYDRFTWMVHVKQGAAAFVYRVFTNPDRPGYGQRIDGVLNKSPQIKEMLARRLLGLEEGDHMHVSYVDGDPLNLTRDNLRAVSQSHTAARRAAKPGELPRGVRRAGGGYEGYIYDGRNASGNSRRRSLGKFTTPEAAYAAWRAEAQRLRGADAVSD